MLLMMPAVSNKMESQLRRFSQLRLSLHILVITIPHNQSPGILYQHSGYRNILFNQHPTWHKWMWVLYCISENFFAPIRKICHFVMKSFRDWAIARSLVLCSVFEIDLFFHVRKYQEFSFFFFFNDMSPTKWKPAPVMLISETCACISKNWFAFLSIQTTTFNLRLIFFSTFS